MSKVSIIIPNFNSDTYLAECLDSCLGQGEIVREIIVVDDHSTDDSLLILDAYKSKYPSLINVFLNPQKGACSARNYGYLKSAGDFIQFLDSDDFLGSKKLNIQLKDLEKYAYKAISFSKTVHLYQYLNGKEKTIIEYGSWSKSYDYPSEFLLALWGGEDLIGGTIQTNAWLIPRNVVDKAGLWNEALSRDQDGEFFARAVLNSEKVIFSSDAEAYYRKVEKGSSITKTNTIAHSRSELDALNLKFQYLQAFKENPFFVRAFAKQYLTIAVNNYLLYPEIYKEAWNRYLELGHRVKAPQIGGSIIEAFKVIFGWKNAIKLKRLLSKY
jgi:glycosyltransferase involved in cell wall biosynthesis